MKLKHCILILSVVAEAEARATTPHLKRHLNNNRAPLFYDPRGFLNRVWKRFDRLLCRLRLRSRCVCREGQLRSLVNDASSTSSSTPTSISLCSGTLNLNEPVNLDAKTIHFTCHSRERCVIRGQGHHRLFEGDPRDVGFTDITFENGYKYVAVNTLPDGGGAISFTGSGEATLTECAFRNNVGSYGGAIFVDTPHNSFWGFAMTIMDSLFENNRAFEMGGVIYNENAFVEILGSKFTDNTAGESGGAIGVNLLGELWTDSYRGEYSVFDGNYANYFGEAICGRYGGRHIYKNTLFFRNSAEKRGGAVDVSYAHTSENRGTTVYLANCAFADNDVVTNLFQDKIGFDIFIGEGDWSYLSASCSTESDEEVIFCDANDQSDIEERAYGNGGWCPGLTDGRLCPATVGGGV